jgi:superfamily I DNA/RNA helicase
LICSAALVAAFVKFVEGWHTKAIAETGSPAEFLEYLDYFVQAKGTIPLPRSQDDAVQLLTAHAAKGLEFGTWPLFAARPLRSPDCLP